MPFRAGPNLILRLRRRDGSMASKKIKGLRLWRGRAIAAHQAAQPHALRCPKLVEKLMAVATGRY